MPKASRQEYQNQQYERKRQPLWIHSLLWEKFVASKYLLSKNRDGFLSVMTAFSFVGICIGVATLIIVMSVMGGFREELLSRIIGMKGHAVIYCIDGLMPDNEAMQKIVPELMKRKDIQNVTPLIEQQAIISFQEQSRGAIVLAMSQESLLGRPLLCDHLKIGDQEEEPSLSDFDHHPGLKSFLGNKVIIGKRMAELMGLSTGDSLTIMNPYGEDTPFGTIPVQQEFEVFGTFEVGMTEYDKSILLMPLSTAQEFFNRQHKLTQIEIFSRDINRNDALVREISSKLKSLSLKNQYQILGWKHSDSHFFQAIQIERNVMFLILMLIVLIAAFNIISGLVMLVKDKTRDIAIMKTLGASSSSIMRIFLLTGSTIGLAGTCLGVILGLIAAAHLDAIVVFIQSLFHVRIFSPEVYYLATIPVKINQAEVILIAGTAIILSLLATIYPAVRAARLDPAKALRES